MSIALCIGLIWRGYCFVAMKWMKAKVKMSCEFSDQHRKTG
ncbi:hypothetical protein E4J49_06300 [Vibrio parahaemolyticus]|nr:hypothetical protein [Vibrio parahaemolyticus]EGQ8384412.1 hypothetical protein [Vibrio parahaemolyticus]EGQ9124468.1 hypothetical protein [Vibrio parahaemolyticus]EGQ9453553.1 hypothetical protein [Vibrio parahaemolyticus]EGQ9543324.1 hypothetical protein [Vibrio parahaemolyticus]